VIDGSDGARSRVEEGVEFGKQVSFLVPDYPFLIQFDACRSFLSRSRNLTPSTRKAWASSAGVRTDSAKTSGAPATPQMSILRFTTGLVFLWVRKMRSM
jgi:hypothetical protein